MKKYAFLFAFLGLMVAGNVSAVTLFSDDFEIYTTGIDLSGQGYWINESSCLSTRVTTSTSESGLRSVEFADWWLGVCNGNIKDLRGQATTTSGITKYAFWCDGTCVLFFHLTPYDGYRYNHMYPNVEINMSIDDGIFMVGATSTDMPIYETRERVAFSFPARTWNYVTMEYDFVNHRARANLNSGVWTAYVPIPAADLYANSIWFEGTQYKIDGLFLDHIYTQPEYLPLCGYGADLTFCNSSTTCAYHNGYWQNGACWFSPPVTTTDFIFYYGENSGYATPTDFVVGLYNFTKPFIENVGSFLASFDNIFDLAQATTYGASMGGAIVTARGYLAIINDFVAGFPLSEIFIFYILTIIVVAVLRVVRILIAIIKPV